DWSSDVCSSDLTAMADLRGEARAVAEQVTDERTLATYFAAEGFFPFWLRGTGREASAEEIAAANRSAERALSMARHLDDATCRADRKSVVQGTGQIQDDWRRAREYSRQRLSFQDRL